MRNKRELWLLHQVAETYSSRPSDIIGVRDDWAAYQFDVAVLMVGRRVEKMTAGGKVSVAAALASMEAVEGQRIETDKRMPAGTTSAREPQFAQQKWRDPRTMVSRKMQVPECGWW